MQRQSSRAWACCWVRSLCSPVEASEQDEKENTELNAEEETSFRRLAMTVNYLAMDGLDIQYAIGRICKGMSKPTVRGLQQLKRLARYLVGVTDVEVEFRNDGDTSCIEVYTDSDWAGCKTTRKSTSGGILCVGGDVVKSWSKTQGSVSLSVGEAEYYAVVKGAAEALGLRSLMADLGTVATIKIISDSTAAKGIACRRGLGKLKHMEVRYLWVQDCVRGGDFIIKYIEGKVNPADVLTKPKSCRECGDLVRRVNVKLCSAA